DAFAGLGATNRRPRAFRRAPPLVPLGRLYRHDRYIGSFLVIQEMRLVTMPARILETIVEKIEAAIGVRGLLDRGPFPDITVSARDAHGIDLAGPQETFYVDAD